MRREYRERFPRNQLQKKPIASDLDMHHGMCVTHVPWCMSGSLTHGGVENVPGIPGACVTRNFTYLERGPWFPCTPCCCCRENCVMVDSIYWLTIFQRIEVTWINEWNKTLKLLPVMDTRAQFCMDAGRWSKLHNWAWLNKRFEIGGHWSAKYIMQYVMTVRHLWPQNVTNSCYFNIPCATIVPW